MESGSKLSGPDDFDKFISAELLDGKNTLFSTNLSANI